MHAVTVDNLSVAIHKDSGSMMRMRNRHASRRIRLSELKRIIGTEVMRSLREGPGRSYSDDYKDDDRYNPERGREKAFRKFTGVSAPVTPDVKRGAVLFLKYGKQAVNGLTTEFIDDLEGLVDDAGSNDVEAVADVIVRNELAGDAPGCALYLAFDEIESEYHDDIAELVESDEYRGELRRYAVKKLSQPRIMKKLATLQPYTG